MRVHATDGAAPRLAYPHLGISGEGTIVLFSEPNEGTVLRPDHENRFPIAYHSDCWDMGEFVRYTGTLTLSND